MPILGTILKKGIKLRETLEQDFTSPFDLQKQELSQLLISARNTQIGREYDFVSVLEEFRNDNPHAFFEKFKEQVITCDYDKIDENGGKKLGQESQMLFGLVKQNFLH